MAINAKELPIYQTVINDAVVLWENLFAIDKPRHAKDGTPIGDGKYNMVVLLTNEAAAPVIAEATKAMKAVSNDEHLIDHRLKKRIVPVEDEALKALGFAFRMKVYSKDPIDVLAKQGGRAIEPDPAEAKREPYPQFHLGVKQGQHVAVVVGLRGFQTSDGDPDLSRFCNGVLVDTVQEPVTLPVSKRPDPRRLFGRLIENDAPGTAASELASLIETV